MDCECLCVLVPISIVTVLVLWYFLKWLLPKPLVSDFKNKFVLITGCDSGFGRMSAIRLDQMGFRVIGTCLTKEGKENLESSCSNRLVGVLMDVTNSKQIHDVFAKVKDLVGEKGVWAVVNNAGYSGVGPIEWYKMKDFRKMADVNLWGLIEVTKVFLPLVKKAEGRIVNMTSVSGFVALGYVAPYSITKYGIEAFSDALRREMRRWKVKVCIIEPQAFKTPINDDLFTKKLQNLYDEASDEIKQQYGERFLNDFLRGVAQKHSERVISPKVHLVIDAITDAITAQNPSLRYRVGRRAYLYAFLAHLPTAMQDRLFIG